MKKRFYPKRLKIRNKMYELSLVNLDEKEENSDTILRGFCVPTAKFIAVEKGLSELEVLSTLIHEVLHAIETEYKFTIPHRMVYGLEVPLARFLADNFHLIPKR